MPLPDLATTERVKLAATLSNTLAAGCITVGYFGPLALLLTTPVPLSDDKTDLMVVAAVVCTIAAAVLHSAGQAVLAIRLRNTDEPQ